MGKRSVEVGATVQAGQQLFTIAQIGDIWVTANFKETQLQRLRPGLKAKIHVDAFDLDFNGYVESMPAASGSITSLLPPENATGNFVKVVQRLPVRLRFDKNQNGLDRLRPGMSVEPKVWLQ
jgi:membrane fusion protein (multidrug efflux system)